MAELKPCPFCGKKPEERSDFYGCIVYSCNQCDYELYPTQWVTRTESAELAEAVELLNRAMNSLEDLLGCLQHDAPIGYVLNASEAEEAILTFLTRHKEKQND